MVNRHAKAALTVAGLVAVACAVSPMTFTTYPLVPTIRVMVTKAAQPAIDSLVSLTRATRKEQAACVTSHQIIPTANHTSVIALAAIGPATPYLSDSVTVMLADSTLRLCLRDQPTVHSHIVPNETWGRPSPFDVQKSAERQAPFDVVVSVPAKGPAKLTIYGMRVSLVSSFGSRSGTGRPDRSERNSISASR